MSEFDFTVRSSPDEKDGTVVDTWEVSLPHQCDQWEIAWGTQDETIAGLKAFVAEALDALSKLEGASPCPHVWVLDNPPASGFTKGMDRYRCEKCDRFVWRSEKK